MLDVGCGAGESLHWAEAHGWEVHGIEPSSMAVEAARRSGLGRVRQGTLESVSYPDDSFDAITLCHVIEHIHSPKRALLECRRILKPPGILIVIAPNSGSPFSGMLGECWPHWDIPRHLYHFARPQLERLLIGCGYVIESFRLSSGLTSAYLHRRAIRQALAGFVRRNRGVRLPPAVVAAVPRLARIAFARWRELGDVLYVRARKAPGG